MTIESLLKEIEARAEANANYCDKVKISMDKIELIGQWSALHSCLKDRCTDIPRLVRMLRLAIDDRNALLNQFYDDAVPEWEIENREKELLAIAKRET